MAKQCYVMFSNTIISAYNNIDIKSHDSAIKNYYSLGYYSTSGFTNLKTNNESDKLNNIYLYQKGCQGNEQCLTGNVQNLEIGKLAFDNSNELIITHSDGTTSKLVDTFNASLEKDETKYQRASCKVDIGEGEKTYILPIIPTIKPDFCTLL